MHHRLLHVNVVKSTVSEHTSTNEPILKGYTKQRQERQGALSTSSGHLTSDMEGKSLIKSKGTEDCLLTRVRSGYSLDGHSPPSDAEDQIGC